MYHSAPHPKLTKLPPDRALVENMIILRQVNKSIAALAELKGIANLIPNQAMLINAIVLQEAKDSSEIENIITTQDELYQAITTANSSMSPEIKEVINYRKALFEGYKLIDQQGFLKLKNICDIQEILVSNNAGLRKLPGTVLKNDKTGKVVYTPPQDYNEIVELMSDFIIHFNETSDLSPLINMAVLHYQFESIHPFYDGNGRTGRLLNILYLILNKIIDVPILYLSSYIIDNKSEYYRLLNDVNRIGAWEDWILYILKGLELTARDTIERISKIRMQLEDAILLVQHKAPKIYRKELVELLFEYPYCKVEFVTKKLGVERKAAARYLNTLVEIGLLRPMKIGRVMLYINVDLYNLLKR
jgi:Fic family protein